MFVGNQTEQVASNEDDGQKERRGHSPPSSSAYISPLHLISQIGLAVVMEKIVSTM